MKRIVSIWLMNFPLDCLKRRQKKAGPSSPSAALDDTHALALTLNQSGNTLIFAANAPALEAGVHQGMRLTDARALLPSLVVQEATPDDDRRMLLQLAEWCQRYGPLTAVEGEDGLWLDITGVAHLFGGEQKLLCDIVNRLDTLGFSCRIGCASTPGAAWAVARFSASLALKDRIVLDGATGESLSVLPVAALRLEPEALHLIGRFGLRTIGALTGVPRASLKRRFPDGDDGQRLCGDVLLRLDQARGLVEEPLKSLMAPPSYWQRHSCAEPIAATDSFHLVLKELLPRLCALMEKDLKGARRLTFSAFHADGGVSRTSVATARPSRDPDHLVRLFRDQIEKLNPGFGVDALILSADAVEELHAHQLSFAGKGEISEVREEIDALVDRLSNHLGAGKVEMVDVVESHIPEQAERRTVALDHAEVVSTRNRPEQPGELGRFDQTQRPLRLLPRPEVITVMAEVPEGPPRQFTWRRLRHRVVRSEGPERIAPEWWHVDQGSFMRTRDYYRVESELGHRFWIFREGLYEDSDDPRAPRWHVHGLFA